MLENKQQEMTLTSLLGATNAYIRRPYLYGGLFYGLFAGLIAYFVASVLFDKLAEAINSFGYLKLLNINIISFSNYEIFLLLLGSSLLGWLGARITLSFQSKVLQDRLLEV